MLRLIAIPIVTVFGLEFGSTLAFAVVTETIFSWPRRRQADHRLDPALDRPVMVAYLMLVAFLFIIINFLVDIAYAALDPRLRARSADDGQVARSPLARFWARVPREPRRGGRARGPRR